MRRLLVPEVVQTSAMDCGPAALTSLLGGCGVPVSYGRLRESCQTDVDGTSIDVLEQVANQLGLSAEQIMLPLDHLLRANAAALPAIVVTRHAFEQTHFVVVWKKYGPLVQVMDPAVGRRWMPARQLLSDVYVHRQKVSADALENWLRSPEFQHVLHNRLRDFVGRSAARQLIDESAQQPGWRGPAALDAAARLTASLVRSRAIGCGRTAHALVRKLWQQALTDPQAIPTQFWFATPAPRPGDNRPIDNVAASLRDARPNGLEPDSGARPRVSERRGHIEAPPAEIADNAGEDVFIHGAVLVRGLGRKSSAPEDTAPLPPELAAASREAGPRPWREALHILGRGDKWSLWTLLLMVLMLSSLSIVEIVLLRGFIDMGRDLGLVEQRLTALALLIGVGVLLWLLEFLLAGNLQRLGRHLEIRFRLAVAEKLPRLIDRYFRSRPVSDMAERSHMVQQLRQLPRLVGQFTQTTLMLVLTTAAIAVFDPVSAPLAILIAGLSLCLPWLFCPWLTELDMRLRTHAGALTRFYFDALRGLSVIQAHVAERNIQREQESLLVDWTRAGRRYLAIALLLEGLQLTCGFGLAAWLLMRHVHALADTGGALLLAYWALSLPELGGSLATLVRQYPWQRNVLLRLLEPLGTPDGESASASTGEFAKISSTDSAPRPEAAVEPRGMAIAFQDVGVVAAGHQILRDVNLTVCPGSQVAVVGPSGGGKSTLFGLLLGWHRAAQGKLLIDGAELDAVRIARLRRETAWVDPAVQLWNRSLVDNLRYGYDDVSAEQLGLVCRQAELLDVLEKLPDGLQTELGESGGLLSGGQGQRIRLGRALLHGGHRLVLLDEPFRGLDRNQRREFARRARDHFQDSTLFLISHDVGDTLEFDRVLVIAEGRIVEDGVPRQLAADQQSLYRRLLDAEEFVRRTMWESSGWRHLRLDAGRLQEVVR